MVKGHKGNLFLLRTALETYDNWEDAKNYIADTQVVSPAYYIVCGLTGNDGAVITHDRDYAGDVW